MKFSVENFFSNWRPHLLKKIWSHLLKKSLIKNYFFLVKDISTIHMTLNAFTTTRMHLATEIWRNKKILKVMTEELLIQLLFLATLYFI